MFSWKPIYMEMAQKLVAYRHKQSELLAWLREMKDAGLPVISLTDSAPSEKAIPLKEIDPFTFFANFNRGIKADHRIEILRLLKAKMKLSAALPSDFDGIPVANLQKAWFFPGTHERNSEDIPLLWEFAADVVQKEPSRLSPDRFKKCLEIKQVGLAKLTMGMFWFQPDRYIALDQVNRTYLIDKYGLAAPSLKTKTLAEYLRLLESVKTVVQTDLPRLSFDAYEHGMKVVVDLSKADEGLLDYMERLAKELQCSVPALVELIKAPELRGESEITNRTIHQMELQEVLAKPGFTKAELKAVVDQLWALQGQTDVIRRNAYFRSDAVLEDTRRLLDDNSGVPVAIRINDFIEAAMEHGYRPEDGEDLTVPAQFASVLLSARYPERFVDFRKGRWNDLYAEVMNTEQPLLRGKHYGHLLTRAGAFASVLAQTPTFRRLFGDAHELWTVAGVAWALKDGASGISRKKEVGKVEGQPVRAALPAKNLILYGPPGTGKTYRLCTEYMERFTERGQPKTKEEVANQLVSEMAWWEVCALVLLDRDHANVGEMLAHPLIQARAAISATKSLRSSLWAHLQSHTKRECAEVAYANRYEPLIFHKSKESVWSIDAALVQAEAPELLEALTAWRAGRTQEGDVTRRYEFTTFHQSFGYEDFVEGIKPVLGSDGAGELSYEVKVGVFKQIARRAALDPEHDYAIFIDEINRGNIASIFGELITLLEEDKRLGGAHPIKARLPYSREEFGVPSNLYVIGTMNTADRSVEALDTALRRRFSFVPCVPQPELLPSGTLPNLDVDLRRMLSVINGRIERLLDSDHCIGHSYFMGVASAGEPLAELRHVFANRVRPLLEEYFYGAPAKIGLVLGPAFVKKRSTPETFAKCGWGQEEEEESKEPFDLIDPIGLDAAAFKAIYA